MQPVCHYVCACVCVCLASLCSVFMWQCMPWCLSEAACLIACILVNKACLIWPQLLIFSSTAQFSWDPLLFLILEIRPHRASSMSSSNTQHIIALRQSLSLKLLMFLFVFSKLASQNPNGPPVSAVTPLQVHVRPCQAYYVGVRIQTQDLTALRASALTPRAIFPASTFGFLRFHCATQGDIELKINSRNWEVLIQQNLEKLSSIGAVERHGGQARDCVSCSTAVSWKNFQWPWQSRSSSHLAQVSGVEEPCEVLTDSHPWQI